MGDTNAVERAVPFRETCAPETNWFPVIERVKEPVGKLMGATLLSNGTGFSRLTLLDDAALESAALTACTVTVAGLGREEGASYSPAEVMVPVDEFPPTTLSTDQLTDVLDVPVTVAVNCWEPPTRTFAVDGEMETDTE